MVDDSRAAQLQNDLVRTGIVSDRDNMTTTTAEHDSIGPSVVVQVKLTVDRLAHFVDILDRRDDLTVQLRLDSTSQELLTAMTRAPDLFTWATKRRRRRRRWQQEDLG